MSIECDGYWESVQHSLQLVLLLVLPWSENWKLHFPDFVASRILSVSQVALISTLMASYAELCWLGKQTEHFVDLNDRQYDPGVLYVMANLAHFVS